MNAPMMTGYLMRLRYRGPTDSRGARILVTWERGGRKHRKVVPWDPSLGTTENYSRAFHIAREVTFPGAIWVSLPNGFDVAIPATDILREVQEILWPDGEKGYEWDSETLDDVARAMRLYSPA